MVTQRFFSDFYMEEITVVAFHLFSARNLKKTFPPPLAKQVGEITIMFVKIDNNSIIKFDIVIIVKL